MDFSNKMCFLCLESINNSLEIFGKQGIDLNIGVILQQHFWFELDTFATKNICEVCWQKVESFHIFYNFVKSIHQQQAEPRGEQTRATKSTTETGLIHCFKEEPIDIKDFSADFTDTLDTIDHLKVESDELAVDKSAVKTRVAHRILQSKPMTSASADTTKFHASNSNDLVLYSNTAKVPTSTATPKSKVMKWIIINLSFDMNDPPTAAPVAQMKWKYIFKTSASPPSPHPNQYKRDDPRSDDLEVDAKGAVTVGNITRTSNRMISASTGTTDSVGLKNYVKVDRTAPKVPASATHRPWKFKPVRSKQTSKTDVHNQLLSQYFNMTCNLCDMLLPSLRDVRNHHREVHGVIRGYLICCNKKFATNRLPQMLSHCEWHMNPDAFKCRQCSRSFPDNVRLQLHFNSVHPPEAEKIFDCNDCDKKFSKQHFLNLHQKTSHDPSLKCPICQKRFTDKLSRRYHIRDIHSPDDELEFRCNYYNKVDRVNKETKPFECDICGCRYQILPYLKNHIKRVHCSVVPKVQSHVCEICAKSFVSAENYKYHYINVHGNMSEKASEKVQCDICGKWFKHKSCLYSHMQCHNSKPATCKICGRACTTRKSLSSHIRITHREASLECKICGKMFKKNLSLKEHMAIHYGITDLYTCAFCPKTFRSNANMHSHRKRAHPVELEKLRKNC